MAMSAEQGQNLQPFAGNGDVSLLLKNVQVGQNTTNKMCYN